MSKISALLPPQLREMSDRLVKDLARGQQQANYLAYVSGWIFTAAKDEYKKLIKRDGIPSNSSIIKLLCELAVTRALVRWHEIRDRPPPMPSIDKL